MRGPRIQDGVMTLSRAQAEALFEVLDWRKRDGTAGSASCCGGMTRRAYSCFGVGLLLPCSVWIDTTSPFDISRFADLPPVVLKAFEVQQAALEASRMETIVEHTARLHKEAVGSEKEGLIVTLKELIEKLES